MSRLEYVPNPPPQTLTEQSAKDLALYLQNELTQLSSYIGDITESANPIGESLLINGGFDIWSKGTIFTAANINFSYLADMWMNEWSLVPAESRVDGVQNTLVGNTAAMSRNSMRTSFLARTASTNQIMSLRHRAEVYLISDSLSEATVTISFVAKATANQVLGVRLRIDGATSPSDYQITGDTVLVTPTPQRFSLTFPMPDLTGNPLTLDATLNTYFTYLAGPDRSEIDRCGTTSIDWTAGALDITDVKIEKGSDVTMYEVPMVEEVIASCARYFRRIYNPKLVGVCYGGTTVGRMGMHLGSPMRIAPTMVANSPLAVYNGVTIGVITSYGAFYPSPENIEFDAVHNIASAASGQAVVVYNNGGGQSIDLQAYLP